MDNYIFPFIKQKNKTPYRGAYLLLSRVNFCCLAGGGCC